MIEEKEIDEKVAAARRDVSATSSIGALHEIVSVFWKELKRRQDNLLSETYGLRQRIRKIEKPDPDPRIQIMANIAQVVSNQVKDSYENRTKALEEMVADLKEKNNAPPEPLSIDELKVLLRQKEDELGQVKGLFEQIKIAQKTLWEFIGAGINAFGMVKQPVFGELLKVTATFLKEHPEEEGK